MARAVPDLNDALSERQAAARLSVSPTTLGNLRRAGKAPPHVEIPGPSGTPIVRYPAAQLEAWLSDRYRPTGSEAEGEAA